MSKQTKSKMIVMDPPKQSELPQGAEEFLQAHRTMHEALFALCAPFLNKHPGIHGNYAQMAEKLKEIGFYANDTITMILRPDLFPMPEPAAPPPALAVAPAPEEGQADA